MALVFGCGGADTSQTYDYIGTQGQGLGTFGMKLNDFNVMQWGCYSGNLLRWQPDGTCVGAYFYGQSLSAQFKWNAGGNTRVADTSGSYSGECVSFVKSLANTAVPPVSQWRKSTKVMGNNIAIGTAIATFRNGSTYVGTADPRTTDHAGFFAGYVGNGFQIYDQNYVSPTLVGRHNIFATGAGNSTDANMYYVLVF